MKELQFRYLVCAPDLNAHGTLHGGVLLRWIDEAAYARLIALSQFLPGPGSSQVGFAARRWHTHLAGGHLSIQIELRESALGDCLMHIGEL